MPTNQKSEDISPLLMDLRRICSRKKSGLDQLFPVSAKAPGADSNLLAVAMLVHHGGLLKVGKPPAAGSPVGVAHVVPRHGAFSAILTYPGHYKPSVGLMHFHPRTLSGENPTYFITRRSLMQVLSKKNFTLPACPATAILGRRQFFMLPCRQPARKRGGVKEIWGKERNLGTFRKYSVMTGYVHGLMLTLTGKDILTF